MGLDSVELVLRVEDFFSIEITDNESEAILTVGSFYELICMKLNILSLDGPNTSKELPIVSRQNKVLGIPFFIKPLPPPADALPWSPQSVWDYLIAILVEQIGIKPAQITYNAKLHDDLGVN